MCCSSPPRGRRLEGLLPFVGAFLVTVIGLPVLDGLAGRTGVTLMVLPALFIVVPGDTLLLQQGATRLAGDLAGTLVAGTVLGAFATLLAAGPRRPPRLILLLGGFFVLTVGGLGVRGVTALLGGDPVSGVQNLAGFALQVPTVAVAIAFGVIVSDRWRRGPAL